MHIQLKGNHSHRSISIGQKQLLLSFCKVVWRRYLGEVGKFLPHFVANTSKTLHINFYQNWSSIVDKKLGVLCLTV